MSHIVEEYAKNLGVKIGKPIITDHFYPVTSDNYITFHTNDKKSPARHYDHWNLAFDILKPFLEKNNIDIIQVGSAEDPPNKNCNFFTLGSSFKQMSYIIKKAKLHLGIDSLPVHIASSYNIPIVGLYSNLYPNCSKPVWSDSQKVVLLSPDFTEIRPSFKDIEENKRVNEIKPESVASSVLDLLSINHNLSTYQTLNIGKFYDTEIFEAIPNFKPDEDFQPSKVVNLRCDYELEEDTLPHWLSYRVNLMTDKQIDLNLLNYHKSNIAGMTLFLDSGDFDVDYLNNLNDLNIEYSLISRSKKDIDDIRFNFFDFVVTEHKAFTKKDIDFSSEICHNTYYHSKKTLISKNKHYSSKAYWKNDIEKSEEKEKLIDCPEMWEEIDHLYIYNYGDKKTKPKK